MSCSGNDRLKVNRLSASFFAYVSRAIGYFTREFRFKKSVQLIEKDSHFNLSVKSFAVQLRDPCVHIIVWGDGTQQLF